MKNGNIIKNMSIKNRLSGKNLTGIIIRMSNEKDKCWVVDFGSGNKYIWLSRECELIYK